MAETVLNVSLRDNVGKGNSRALRREGLAPAVVYGRGLETCSLVVEPKELHKVLSTDAGLNALITLKGDGPFDGKVVIVKDLQEDPIKRDILHVDFKTIDLKEKISVLVPVHTIGQSAGEKEGGQLQVVRHELEVYCLPTAIPRAIEVDVTALEIGDVVHIEDVPLEPGVEVPHDVNFTVVTVVGLRPEEEEEVEEEELEEGAEAVAEEGAEETEEESGGEE